MCTLQLRLVTQADENTLIVAGPNGVVLERTRVGDHFDGQELWKDFGTAV